MRKIKFTNGELYTILSLTLFVIYCVSSSYIYLSLAGLLELIVSLRKQYSFLERPNVSSGACILFNEMDTFLAVTGVNTKYILDGVCMDPRIGSGREHGHDYAISVVVSFYYINKEIRNGYAEGIGNHTGL